MPAGDGLRLGRDLRAQVRRAEHLDSSAPAQEPTHEVPFVPNGVDIDGPACIQLLAQEGEGLALAHPAFGVWIEPHASLGGAGLPVLAHAWCDVPLAER